MRQAQSGVTFWRGAIEAVAVVAAFVASGLGWAVLQKEAVAEPSVYAPVVAESDAAEPSVWLVDGFNVLCAGLLGGRDRAEWWSGARRGELLALADRFDDRDAEVWVVFDGSRPAAEAGETGHAGGGDGRARRVFAPSADAWLLAELRARGAGTAVAVVTADRQLAGRARHRGARVVSPREFLARCSEGTDSTS